MARLAGVQYSYYEVRANGRTMARFVGKRTASVFLEAWKNERLEAGAALNNYEIVEVKRRDL